MSYCYFVKLNNESGLVFTVGYYCAKFAKFDLLHFTRQSGDTFKVWREIRRAFCCTSTAE